MVSDRRLRAQKTVTSLLCTIANAATECLASPQAGRVGALPTCVVRTPVLTLIAARYAIRFATEPQ